MSNTTEQKVLFLLSGSIACFKACELISRLVKRGIAVQTVASPSALRFVGAATLEGLTGRPPFTDLYQPGRAMDHIELARWAQALVVAPATADLIARFALGLGDDLLTTLALALPAGVPRLVSPAMNPNMLAQPAVKRNLATLVDDGWTLVEPASGHMACGDAGAGRLPEPAVLAARVRELLGA